MKKKLIVLFSLLLFLCGCTSESGVVVEPEEELVPIAYSDPIYVVTKKDSGITTVEELADKVVAFQTKFDLSASKYAFTELYNAGYKEENAKYLNSYHELPDLIKDNKIDAWIISKPEHELLNDYVYYYVPEDYKILAEYKIPYYEDYILDTSITSDTLYTKPFLVMCTGIDERAKPDDNANCRNDVNILMCVDPVKKHVLTVSFPRDSYIYGVTNGYQDKLTHLGVWGGVENIKDSVGKLLDEEVPYYCQVSFSSFIDLITKLGGVYVDVPLDMTMNQDSYRNVKQPVVLEKGYFKLYGEWALALCRNRKYDGIVGGDYGRIRNQALVVNGIINRISKYPILVDWCDFIVNNKDFTYHNFTDSQVNTLLQVAREFANGYTVDNYFIENIGDMTDYGASIGRVTDRTIQIAKGKIDMILNDEIDKDNPYYEEIVKGYVTGGSGKEGYIGTEYSLEDIYGIKEVVQE